MAKSIKHGTRTSIQATATTSSGSTDSYPPQVQRLINRVPHIAVDLVNAPPETLFCEAVQARHIANGASASLRRALIEIDRLEGLLGIGEGN